MASLTAKQIAELSSGLGSIKTTYRLPGLNTQGGQLFAMVTGVQVIQTRTGGLAYKYNFLPLHVVSGGHTVGREVCHFIQKPDRADYLSYFARDLKEILSVLLDVSFDSLEGKEFEDEITRACGIDPQSGVLIGDGDSPHVGKVVLINLTPAMDKKTGQQVKDKAGNDIFRPSFARLVPLEAVMEKMTEQERDIIGEDATFLAAVDGKSSSDVKGKNDEMPPF